MSQKNKAVGIAGVCPHCGEAVEFALSKAEVKLLYKGFKIGQEAAEKELQKLRLSNKRP